MSEDLPFHRGRHPALVLFALTFFNMFIVVYSLRAVAEDDFWGVFLTDVVYGLLGFTVFKKMQDAHTKWEMAAYTAGVAGGSQAAMHAYQALML